MTIQVSPDMSTVTGKVLSSGTRVGYAADWSLFTDWCAATEHIPLPADAATTSADTGVRIVVNNPTTTQAGATTDKPLSFVLHTFRVVNLGGRSRHPPLRAELGDVQHDRRRPEQLS